jgi:hypothetical protein
MLRSLSIGIFLASAVRIMGADMTSLTAIGLVRASGEFSIDGSWIRDNSTVFDGSVISTTHAASHVVLEDGTRIDLGLDARGRIYRDHVAIERGLAQISTSKRYAVVAGKIRIDSPQRSLVLVTDSGKAVVTAVQGVTEVNNRRGVLVAMVSPGRTLEFSDADTSAEDAAIAGCLERVESKSGDRITVHYVLQDQTTHVVAEVVGAALEPLVGWIVGVTGSIDPNTKPISPATKLIRVQDLNNSSQERCKGPLGAAAPPSAPPSAPPTAPGLSGLAKAGILGGIVVGGTVSGLLGSGVIGGGSAATTPSVASR